MRRRGVKSFGAYAGDGMLGHVGGRWVDGDAWRDRIGADQVRCSWGF